MQQIDGGIQHLEQLLRNFQQGFEAQASELGVSWEGASAQHVVCEAVEELDYGGNFGTATFQLLLINLYMRGKHRRRCDVSLPKETCYQGACTCRACDRCSNAQHSCGKLPSHDTSFQPPGSGTTRCKTCQSCEQCKFASASDPREVLRKLPIR